MIQYTNCQFWAGNFKAFDDFNFELKQGEHLKICGANGSGKTLFIKALCGKMLLRSGNISVENNMPLKDLVAHVPARTFELLFNSSVNLFYQQRYYSVANEDVQTVRQVLGKTLNDVTKYFAHPHFNIESLLDLKVTGLSNGQLRKLVLLKTLSSHPKFMVLDYPYEGLDDKSRNELNELLKELVDGFGITLIIVDNDNVLPNLLFKEHCIESLPKSIDELSLQTNSSSVNVENKGLPVIELKNITIQYGSKTIIEEFNWKVVKGERWLLLGPNGSGKSTILSLIFADHPQVYKNDIQLFGKKRGSGESIWEIKNRISFLSAEMFTYAESSYKNNQKVSDFLLTHFHGPFEGEGLNAKDLERKALEMLKYFGLDSLKNAFFRNLSSGHKQLLLLIRTFLYKKELILLDEPFQYLDAENKQLAKTFITRMLNKEDTFIVISHHAKDEFESIEKIKSL